jgi:hypothetical protein
MRTLLGESTRNSVDGRQLTHAVGRDESCSSVNPGISIGGVCAYLVRVDLTGYTPLSSLLDPIQCKFGSSSM